MREIENFKILSKINERQNVITFHALQLSDQRKVILKTFTSEFPATLDLINLQHEFDILKALDSPGVLQPYELIKSQHSEILVLEDSEGQTLKDFLSYKRVSLKQFFIIALQLAEILSNIHHHKIIHKGIHPESFIIDPHTLKIKIVDFSDAIESSSETQENLSPLLTDTRLSYNSPEQTGRMNRPLDYRSDFYSLGIILYEMLTGQLPFVSNDPMELIHYHLAKKAMDITSINKTVPTMVSLIVDKLLAKIPEERYSSAGGIKADLINCQMKFNAKGKIDSFVLGKNDYQENLYVSQKLYGRDDQIHVLLDTFEKVCCGSTEVLLVSGYSGIGKTSLVRELYQPILEKRGLFISGKFDQYQRNLPYSAIIRAFQELIRKFLVEPEEKLAALRQNLLGALGGNAGVITRVIPEVELLIGKQAAPSPLPFDQAQNRFKTVFQNFVQIFAQADHPLILFIDDLQWADSASLDLISSILTNYTMQHLLLIGAYRDNEVNASHPLIIAVNHLKQAQVAITNVQLQPLHLADINQLLVDSLSSSSSKEVFSLGTLLENKTAGNPFFINVFLNTLHQNGWLDFSYKNKKWQWDIEKIEGQHITDNVVDLLAARIAKTPKQSQEILKLASCIGNIFDLKTLAIISHLTVSEVATLLSSAIQQDFIAPLGANAYDRGREEIKYKFVHDRIQQAANVLIPKGEQQRTNLQIGRLLLADNSWQDDEKLLLNILIHFNNSLELITDPSEQYQLAELNYRAGKIAKSSAAYQGALSYFNAGIQLLREEGWEEHYELMFNLNKELSECEYIVGEITSAEKLFDKLLEKTHDNLDKGEIYLMKLRLYTSTGRHEESIITGLKALSIFDVHIPLHPNKVQILMQVMRVIGLAYYHRIPKMNMPVTHDKNILLINDIVEALFPSAGYSNNELLVYLFSKSIILSFKYGCTHYTSEAYFGYFIILTSAFNNFKLAFRFRDFSQKIAGKFDDNLMSIKMNFLNACFYHHWRYPAITNLEQLDKVYQLALEAGFLVFAIPARDVIFMTKLYAGRPLSEVQQESETNLNFYHQVDSVGYYRYQVLIHKYILLMQGDNLKTDTIQSVDQTLNALKEDGHVMLYDFVATYLGIYYYMKGDYSQALKYAELAVNLKDIMLSTIIFAEAQVLYGLAIARCYPEFNPKEKRIYLRKLIKIKRLSKVWAQTCADNFLYRYQFVCAEIARIKGNADEAAKLYNAAINSSLESGNLYYAIMVSECAATFYWNQGEKRLAKSNLQDAYKYSLSWGSNTKSKLLEEQYSQWFLTKEITSKSSLDMKTATTGTSVDLISVLKISQAISSEINLRFLLKKLIHLATENAGAQRGVLILNTNEQWEVSAEAKLKTTKVFHKTFPLMTYATLPLSLITYVIRTMENVILADACKNNQFINDPYILEAKPKSVLCLPIIRHNKFTGILYLENNLTTNAFTPDRLNIFNILSPQVAISIENARLYEATSRFVPEPMLKILHKDSVLDIKPGDCIEKKITVMFTDIRNFTHLSEEMASNETFAYVNDYVQHMVPIIFKYEGFIVQYQGDAILSVFPRQANDAIQAALEMEVELIKFNEIKRAQKKPEIKVGYGINTGEAMLGLLGVEKRIDATVESDAINLASRIESLNKFYGTIILTSNLTFEALENYPHFEFRIIDKVRVKGRLQSIYLYEVLPPLSDIEENTRKTKMQLYSQAFSKYENNDFPAAYELFTSYLEINPQDQPSKILQKRCQIFMETGTPEGWDGVFKMLEK